LKKSKRIYSFLYLIVIFTLILSVTSYISKNDKTIQQPDNPNNSKKSTQIDTFKSLSTQDKINLFDQDTLVLNDMTQPELSHNELSSDFVLTIIDNPYNKLFQENPDFVGWINIDDTNIDLPILKGKDNDFYLTHDFYLEESFYGSIFMDYRNFGMGYDKNTIIYGHNMKDRQMFGDLSSFMDPSFASNHSIISIDTLYGTKTYRIFSVYFDEADGDLIQTNFKGDEFDSFLSRIEDSSVYDFGIDVSTSDAILTLITCSYDIDNGRYFVHAVEI